MPLPLSIEENVLGSLSRPDRVRYSWQRGITDHDRWTNLRRGSREGYRLRREGTGFASTGGIPPGLQLHADGTLRVADMNRGILPVKYEGIAESLVAQWRGSWKRFRERIGRGGPDGIDFDIEGDLLVSNWSCGHLDAFSPSGQLLERVKVPFEKPSDVHFYGPNSRENLPTERSSRELWRGIWRYEGQHQFGWPKLAPTPHS